MNVMLLNDTANIGHVGCQAVSDAHARMLGRAGHAITHRYFVGEVGRFCYADSATGIARVLSDQTMIAALAEVDAVIVNGEGTIHHGAGVEYLNILGAAQSLGKMTLLVNAVLEDVTGFDSVFEQLQDLTVRDLRSLSYMRARGAPCRLVYDSFLEAQFSEEPALDLAGRIVVTDWHHTRDHDVGARCLSFIGGRKAGEVFFLPFLCQDLAEAWAAVPKTLATARAVITGRHHGVYAAALAGVPFIAFGGNTHKIEGLFDDFPELAFCLNPEFIDQALAMALERRELFVTMGRRLQEARPLSTFAALGTGSDAQGEARELARLSQDRARAALTPIDRAYRIRRRSDEVCIGRAGNQH